MDRNSPTQPRILRAREREQEALRLRLSGVTFEQIGERLGITKQAAHKAVKRVLLKNMQKLSETAEELTQLETERLDRMLSAIWGQVIQGSYGAIDRALKIEESRRKLLGLDKKPDDTATTVEIRIVRDNDLK